MKKTIRSIFAMLLVLCMVFTIVGCGEANTESTPNTDDDFFTDTVVDNAGQNGDTTSDGTASNEDGNQGGSSQGSVSTVIPDANKVGGKPWKEVLASMPKKLRGTSITVYNWNPASEYTGAPAVMDQFTQQTGIKVKWVTISGVANYFTKLAAVIASGKDIPDVVRARGPLPEQMVSYQPLYTTNYDFSDEAWDKKILDLYTVDGISYAASLQNTHIAAIDVMFYNKSLIDKYDLEDPYKLWKKGKWNWEKYIDMCREYKTLSESDAASCGEGWWWSYVSIFDIDSAIAFDGKKFYNNMGSKEFLTVHQELTKLYREEHLFAFGQEPEFSKGMRLFSIGTSIHMRRKNSYFGPLKSEGVLYAVPMPARKGEKYVVGLSEAEAYAIANGAPNPEAVPYFLRYFLDGANYELSTYFCNEQNLEVYNYCMSQKNRKFVYTYPDCIGGFRSVDPTSLMGQTSDQIKSYIDSKTGEVDKVVKEFNNTIKKIKK